MSPRIAVRAATAALLILGVVMASVARAQTGTLPPVPIGVRPLLVDAASEARGVIAQPDNPIWPGWNAADTPLLLYLPGHQDYSALASSKVGLAFTPFGLTRVDSVRTIFDQIPIHATFADTSRLDETLALPLLCDTHRRELRLRLEAAVTAAELARLAGAERVGSAKPGPLSLKLPGVTLDLKNATVSLERNTIRVGLKPPPK